MVILILFIMCLLVADWLFPYP